uniref:Uncharacterized protein n=1 Tax=Rhipicephalus pulchellus TaxID=72859 RepID=L7LWV2_RHIPC
MAPNCCSESNKGSALTRWIKATKLLNYGPMLRFCYPGGVGDVFWKIYGRARISKTSTVAHVDVVRIDSFAKTVLAFFRSASTFHRMSDARGRHV